MLQESWSHYMLKRLIGYLNYQLDLPQSLDFSESRHLDLGCGDQPRNPFGAEICVGTDFDSFQRVQSNSVQFVTADLTNTLPFPDNSFSSMSAYDVLEHIPRWERNKNGSIVFPFVQLMSEIHRILKPGGIFYAVTPGYPSEAAFQDPTHINFITLGTLNYFAAGTSHARTLGYGFEGEFEVLHNSWLRGSGPFAQSKLVRADSTSKERFISRLRLIRRFFLLCQNRSPMHILWVLQKA